MNNNFPYYLQWSECILDIVTVQLIVPKCSVLLLPFVLANVVQCSTPADHTVLVAVSLVGSVGSVSLLHWPLYDCALLVPFSDFHSST